MSRIGKIPVAIPAGVTVTLAEALLTVKGPKGTLTLDVRPDVNIAIGDSEVKLTPGKTDLAKALWGTYTAILGNMVKGVTEGFTRILDVEGVGYKAEVRGSDLVLSVGYSHPVVLAIPQGISALVEKNAITLSGANKEELGQFAANVRKVRKPEPYKGKGIRYRGEFIIRKQGKKAV